MRAYVLRRRVFLAVTVGAATAFLAGCPGAGAGNTGGSDQEVPSGFAYMRLAYETTATGDGEATQVIIATSKQTVLDGAPGDSVSFRVYDSSASWEVDDGTYTFDPTDTSLDTYPAGSISAEMLWFALGGRTEGGETVYDRYGLPVPPSTFFGSDPVPAWYEQIAVTDVTVSSSSGEYSFSWTFTTADGELITGSYQGVPDDVNDGSGGFIITSAAAGVADG